MINKAIFFYHLNFRTAIVMVSLHHIKYFKESIFAEKWSAKTVLAAQTHWQVIDWISKLAAGRLESPSELVGRVLKTSPAANPETL